jgi:hypothetical protein
MEQAVPDATGHGQSRLFVVHAQTTAGCGYARYPRGRSVPPSKIQAATHQASLKRKIKNDSAHCSWASTIIYGKCRIEELKTAGPCDRPHMKEYCHGDESQDDEDSGQEGWRKEETGQGHESLELEHEEVAGQESRREKS